MKLFSCVPAGLAGSVLVFGAAFAADMIPSSKIAIGPGNALTELDVTADPKAYELLPAAIKDAGVIVIGVESNAGYPNSVTKNGENYGLTIDLGRALAATAGMKAEFRTMPFTAMIPSIDSARVDFSSVLFNDTPKRREAIDFLNAAYSLGSTLIMRKDATGEPLTLKTACGHVISASASSQQATVLGERTKTCEAEGQKPIDIKLTQNNAEALLAVKSSRVEAALLSTLQVRYIEKADPDLNSASSEQPTRTNATAFGFKKGSELLPALRAALLTMRANGSLEQVLTQYNYAAGLASVELINNTKPLLPGEPLP